jgi:hypothetical protein
LFWRQGHFFCFFADLAVGFLMGVAALDFPLRLAGAFRFAWRSSSSDSVSSLPDASPWSCNTVLVGEALPLRDTGFEGPGMLCTGEGTRGVLSGTGESCRAATGRVGVFVGRGMGRGRGTGRGVGRTRAGEEGGGVLGIFS